MMPDLKPVPDGKLVDLLRACQLAPVLAEAIRERVIDAEASGRTVAGVRVDQGRPGPRKWKHEQDTEALLRRYYPAKLDAGGFHMRKLMSPTQMAKADPEAYDTCELCYERSPGTKSVKLADDAQDRLIKRGKRAAEENRLASKLAEQS